MSFREIRYFDCANYMKRHSVANIQSLKRVRKYYLQLLVCFRSPRIMCVLFLTLRLLMSYIYMERLFLMFLDHTQRRSTVGRTPLDE